MNSFLTRLSAALALCLPLLAHAAIDPALLQPLAGDDPDARVEAVARIAATGSADARQVLQALLDDELVATPAGQVLIVHDGQAIDAATGKTLAVPDGADTVHVCLSRDRAGQYQQLSAAVNERRRARLGRIRRRGVFACWREQM